jgi:dipeptidyl aminopeptidase/acylaminoacyl peptidase
MFSQSDDFASFSSAPCRPAGETMRRLTNLRPELEEVAFGIQERLSWTSSDGLEIDGLLVMPPGKSRRDGPFPTLTLVHGGPYARWAASLRLTWAFPAQWFAARGYAVLLPNPRAGWVTVPASLNE